MNRTASSMHEVVGVLAKRDELKDRVDARKHDLLSKFHELKADTRHEAAERRDQIKAKLDELEAHLKTSWNEMTDAVRARLDKWLDERRDKDRARE